MYRGIIYFPKQKKGTILLKIFGKKEKMAAENIAVENKTTEKTQTSYQERSNNRTRRIVQVGMLGAVAAVLMFLEFPLPFIAPTFYKLDFSEVPVLIGGFAMGPVAGVIIEAIKIALHLLFKGTQTAFVGELGNFIMGCALIVPAAVIYKHKKSKKTALIGLIVGIIVMAVASVFVNGYMLLPAYGAAFHMDVNAFVAMGTAINPAINSLWKFCLLAVAPFNIFKGILVTILTMLLYKHIRKVLK